MPISKDDCWIWGGRFLGEYGRFYDKDTKIMIPAHRLTYEDAKGAVPDGLELDHLCFNPPCVNPDHLEAVTHYENMQRLKALKTHCPQGHEYSPENTYYYTYSKERWTGRMCRACDRIRKKTKYDLLKLRPKEKS